ncbi:MAG: hypothetical protein M1824_003810 [Vezdaea acicularis]|nr:MAG: hypothetical protein M1824_003810 [Vezdaea acicularis]
MSGLATESSFPDITKKISLGLIIASPILIALPPRKFDLYTIVLSGTFVLSANHYIKASSGRSILDHVKARSPPLDGLPSDRAREVQRTLRQVRRIDHSAEDRGVLDKLWMGNEKEGWKERRIREEKERLARGDGYGSMIMSYVRDVWKGEKDGSTGENDDSDGKE